MQKKYGALRFLIGLYKVLAWIVLALGVIAAIAAIVSGATGFALPGRMMGRMTYIPQQMDIVRGLATAAFILVYTAILFVTLWAGSEFVSLFIDIERNTRESALYLKGELDNAPARQAPITWNKPGPNA